jgi:mannose-1-phosphate guanylyltransferase
MKIIIFAGGTGKRFWPVSRKQSPKQFQSVIDDKPLIKLKYDYLRLKFEAKDIFLSTGSQYKNEVENILGDLPKENFIFEPAMIDNGAAVALAVSYIHAKFPNEVISIQWADHYIKKPEVFAEALFEAGKLAEENNKTIIIGVPARYASPSLGYIQFDGKIKDITTDTVLYGFEKFVEKPTAEIAQQYIDSKIYLWNPGYMVVNPNSILEKYQKYSPEIFEGIQKIAQSNFSEEAMAAYSTLPKIAFDKIFSENLSKDEAQVLSVEMGWNDVGEWTSLKEALEISPESNVTLGNVIDMNSQNSIIYNYEDKKLISTINLKDMVVVNTPDAVAIFHRNDNNALKEYLKLLEEKGYTNYL